MKNLKMTLLVVLAVFSCKLAAFDYNLKNYTADEASVILKEKKGVQTTVTVPAATKTSTGGMAPGAASTKWGGKLSEVIVDSASASNLKATPASNFKHKGANIEIRQSGGATTVKIYNIG